MSLWWYGCIATCKESAVATIKLTKQFTCSTFITLKWFSFVQQSGDGVQSIHPPPPKKIGGNQMSLNPVYAVFFLVGREGGRGGILIKLTLEKLKIEELLYAMILQAMVRQF